MKIYRLYDIIISHHIIIYNYVIYNYYTMCTFPIAIRRIKLYAYSGWEKCAIWKNTTVYKNRKYFNKCADNDIPNWESGILQSKCYLHLQELQKITLKFTWKTKSEMRFSHTLTEWFKLVNSRKQHDKAS